MSVRRNPTAGGFTMLEVLISIVIIAFGLLGIAGLQAFALKHNHSASLRLTATALASDMIDRIKANPAAIDTRLYHQPATSAYTTAVPGCTTAAGICSSADLATNDRFEWQTRVAQLLPGGVGIVCVDSTPADGVPAAAECDDLGTVGYTVKIWWTDHRTATVVTQDNPNPERQLFWTMFNP